MSGVTPAPHGAFAEFVTIHEDFAFALPDGMSDDMGALMEPLSVGIWACRKAGVTAGDRVLVTGAGPIGLLAMQVAKAFGATDVAISDVNEKRLAFAERLGATRALRAAASTSRPSSPATTPWTRPRVPCAPDTRTPPASRSWSTLGRRADAGVRRLRRRTPPSQALPSS